MNKIQRLLLGAALACPQQLPTDCADKIERRKAADRERRKRWYREKKAASPDLFLAAERERNKANRERARLLDPEGVRAKERERARRRREQSPGLFAAYVKTWRERNPDKSRENQRKQWDRIKKDPAKAIHARISTLVRMTLKSNGKSQSISVSLGYTIEELRAHLERQFLPGMGWHNMGEWHIDHIVPVSAFDFTSDQDPEFRRAWHIANLRPLWGSDNVRKSNRITHLV